MGELDFYFDELKRGVDVAYGVAEVARAKGVDPVDEVECPLALNIDRKSVV